MYNFSVDYKAFDVTDITNIHKYFMKKHDTKWCLCKLQKIFVRLLTSILSASNHTKCVLLSNDKCMTQPTLINLHLNEYT